MTADFNNLTDEEIMNLASDMEQDQSFMDMLIGGGDTCNPSTCTPLPYPAVCDGMTSADYSSHTAPADGGGV